jgi:4-amino-4-deoxy-L-arabinose transferase-like glycosyltransferase
VVAAIVGTSEPLVLDLGWGNLNSIQVAMLVGYLALRWGAVTPRRSIAAGALLGFAILTKPNLALIVPLLVVELLLARRYRDVSLQVAGLAAGALVGVLISAVRFGSIEPWFGWIDALRTLAPNYIWRENSVPANILSLTGSGGSGAAALLSVIIMGSLSVLAAIVLVLADRGLTRRLGDGDRHTGTRTEEDRWRREVLVMGIAVAITLVGAPFAWNHYFLLAAPLLVYLLRPTQAGDVLGGPIGGRQIAAIAAFVFFSAEPAKIVSAPADTVPYFVCLVIGTVILLAAALWELGRVAQPTACSATPGIHGA